MRISDWSSDVCSSDLVPPHSDHSLSKVSTILLTATISFSSTVSLYPSRVWTPIWSPTRYAAWTGLSASTRYSSTLHSPLRSTDTRYLAITRPRSEEHTSELQSLMRISYAVFCLKKKNIHLSIHPIRRHITSQRTVTY